MDRRKTLKLLAATAASGAFLAVTGLKASENTSHISYNSTENEYGRGIYWTIALMDVEPHLIVLAVLQDRDSLHTVVDGTSYWNPFSHKSLPIKHTRKEFEDTKREVFDKLEEYWKNPRPSNQNYRTVERAT
jgi:uncharacterized protein YqjF (DUF2071 family)